MKQGIGVSAHQSNAQLGREEVIDLRHYWRVLMKNKWNIVGFSAVITVFVILIVFSMRPVYQSSATVLIESESAKLLSIEEVYGINSQNQEYFLTQFEILKSRRLAERVVDSLNLTQHPEFDPRQKSGFSLKSLLPIGEEKQLNEALVRAVVIQSFKNRLTISPVHNTQLVKVTFESYGPELAKDVANTMVEEFINSHLEAKLEVTAKATTWLSSRMEGLSDKLEASELRLQEYREQEQLVDVKGILTLSTQELEELTTQFVQARQKRSQLENIYTQVDLLRNKSASELLSIPEVLNHPIIKSLRENEAEAQRRVAELSERYGPKHPQMIAAVAERDSATEDIRKQVQDIIVGIGREYQAAKQSEQSLQASIDAMKQRVQSISRKEFKVRELEREVNANRQLYDMFVKRLKETDETGGNVSAHARLVDPAVTALQPVKPKKKLIVVLAALMSGMLAAGIALLLDLLDSTLKRPEDVEERLHESLLGLVPQVKGKETDVAFNGFTHDKQSSFAEAIRTIRTGFVLSSLDEPAKVTVVTSSLPNEGKSTISLNLTLALAQMEKVLLIDADMRHPTLAKTCGFGHHTPGLSNLVAGSADVKQCIHKWEEGGIDVMPAGVVPANPLELLSSKRFTQVLEGLAKYYDRIIIDSPPTQAVSDSLVLSSHADAMIYVVKADTTHIPVVKNGIKRLRDVNAPIVGVVLNAIDTDKATRYDGYYGTYYGQEAQEMPIKDA